MTRAVFKPLKPRSMNTILPVVIVVPIAVVAGIVAVVDAAASVIQTL